jgi:aryl-alcohol dehydrogenase-like predicted oxidoreductase
MRYKLFGTSGLRVSELCLGTMTFGEGRGWMATEEESRKIFDAFVKAGGNFIDTANVYTEGVSERLVGEFISTDREYFVVATKYTISTRHGDPNAGGNHRKNMMRSVEASLRRLNTDHIDLYWVHAWDFMTPVEEVLRGLDDLVRQGKVLYGGISNAPAWIISHANTVASFHGWTPFAGIQIEYSLVERTPERELLPMARAFDLAILAWSPLAAGVLTGKYLGGRAGEQTRIKEGSHRLKERNHRIAERVVAIAAELGCSPAQIALAWLRQRPGVVIPILGARSEAQIKDNLGCLSIQLQEEHLKQLDEVSAIEPGYPHEFLARNHIRKIIYSDRYDSIANHRRNG